jgi:radical SAM protein with 4Fe4S-binding SPASM domain
VPDPREEVFRLARDRCIPLTVTLELTMRCNLRCVHCYNFDRAAPPPASGTPLADAEILDVIDQVRRAGALTLAFTGGEALTHPSLEAFAAHARERRMQVGLKTNGTRLDPARAARLAAAGCGSAQISLYGACAATHDAFTGSPGSFEATLAGIRAAREAGIAVALSFSLTRANAAEAGAMLALADRLGVPCAVDPQLTARYDGTTGPLDLRVDRATLLALYRGPLRQMLPSPCRSPDRGVQCNCARSVCGISAAGEVYPCIGAPVPAGNLRERSFEEIWRDSPVLNRIRALRLVDFPSCAPCPDRRACRRSSGVAYVNTGDYTGADPWTCMEAGVLAELQGR